MACISLLCEIDDKIIIFHKGRRWIKMDILKILHDSADDLIPEDLDFFETELATGEDYSVTYKVKCISRINQIRKWLCGESDSSDVNTCKEYEDVILDVGQGNQLTVKVKNSNGKKVGDKSQGIVVASSDIVPEGVETAMPKLTPIEQFKEDLKILRSGANYKSAFKQYAKQSSIIDSEFLDKNFCIFDIWEVNAIVSVKQLGEEFLEKYFGAIDKEKIARYQLFSESFFIKHFGQMDADIVLEHGKNAWRKKENRSKQLDVFLRLKGVKI